MPLNCEGSITIDFRDLGTVRGDAAARHLWERYFDDMVRVARQKRLKLRVRAGGAAEDEEDAALSAFDSFCRGAERGLYPLLAGRDELWRLLAKITVRKALDQIQRQGTIKRGRGRLVDEAGLAGGDRSKPRVRLDDFADRGFSHEVAAMAAEEYQRLWSRLGDDSLRLVLDLSLDGCTREEIAAKLGRTTKTVARKQEVIRTVWLEGEDRS
jgi:DNA-directed RNA polymerase specialized sigma24 family protein